MSIQRFLTYIQYSTQRPTRPELRLGTDDVLPYFISVPRWNAMLAWAKTRGYIS
jgi:hypothetical protein